MFLKNLTAFWQNPFFCTVKENPEIQIDEKNFTLKPLQIDLKPLDKKFTEVGVFYDSSLLQYPYEDIEENGERVSTSTIVDSDEVITVDSKEMNTVDSNVVSETDNINDTSQMGETDCESVKIIDTSFDPEEVKEAHQLQRGSGKVTDKGDMSFDIKDNRVLTDFEIVELKHLLNDSERKLKDRKMKTTSLKLRLANIERKNAEKKLSVQKRDRKIKDLEEMIKIKDGELVKKDTIISNLRKENERLRKSRSGQHKSSNSRSNISNCIGQNSREPLKINDDDKVIEENLSSDSTIETVESISAFLTKLADTEGPTSPKQRNNKKRARDEGTAEQTTIDAPKNKEKGDIVINYDDVIEISEDPDDSIATLCSDDEVQLINDGEEGTLLNKMLEDHPTFLPNKVLNVQDRNMNSFLKLKPFASLCSEIPNLMEGSLVTEKRNRCSQSKTKPEGFYGLPTKEVNLDLFLREIFKN